MMQTRMVVALGALVALFLLITGVHINAVGTGKKLERADWMKLEKARTEAQTALLRKHAQDLSALQTLHNKINREVSATYETEILAVRALRDRDRAAVDATGGLRVARSVCTAPAAAAKTAGDRFNDEAAAATVRLPQSVEDRLWNLAYDADEVTAQARACQNWIRSNGFYGPEKVPDPAPSAAPSE